MIQLFDNGSDMPVECARGDVCIALEDEVRIADGGPGRPLGGAGLSQSDAIIDADRIFRSAYSKRYQKTTDVPWADILGPQVILYGISKILRSHRAIGRALDGASGSVVLHTSNSIVEAIVGDARPKDSRPGRTTPTMQRATRHVRRLFPTLEAGYECVGLWAKSKMGRRLRVTRTDRCDTLIWCQNGGHQATGFAVAEAMAAHGDRAICIVRRDAGRRHAVAVGTFRDRAWVRGVHRVLPGLRASLQDIAHAVLEDRRLVGGASCDHLGATLHDELRYRYVPRAADAWMVASNALDRFQPRSVLIQDVADYRTRALAIQARQRGIPVVHHQFGNISHEGASIEWLWDCADLYAVWGPASADLATDLGVPVQKIRVVGTPRMTGAAAVRDDFSSGAAPGLRTVLFPLFPCSPLTFGNGGATTLAEGREVLQALLGWAATAQDTTRLVLKPRPLRDDAWCWPLLRDVPPNVEILSPDIPVGEALKQTGCLVTPYSAVALEAILSEIPVVLIRLATADAVEPHPYLRMNLAIEVASQQELGAAIDRVFEDAAFRSRMISQQRAHRESLIAHRSSDSAQRIADLLSGLGHGLPAERLLAAPAVSGL